LFGIINIDKPSGCTSHDIVAFVRILAGRKIKVGHSGTLDPLATGVLPVFTGKCTRLIQYIALDNKEYIFTADLSFKTDSADIDGKVIERFSSTAEPTEDELKDVAMNFVGHIKQKAPMFSAVSINGTRLYKLARQGKVVERPFRDVEIHSLKLLNYDYPKVTFKVSCSRGTYVRTLAEDIGASLNLGGCIVALRRTYSGGLSEKTSITPFELISRYIKTGTEDIFSSFETVFSDCSTCIVTEKTVSLIKNGRKITEEDVKYIKNNETDSEINNRLLVFSEDGSLVAMYKKETDSGLLAAEKVLL